ncbi:hypothetical protein K461DRAFT_279756 [Myriangium duriaei CBS 260.36]|uniref:DUF3074 domain-containing protein n=1 Tax=Myriangium duriaei CBS 260.36 TaxID=1168546 RepID=A0A9P4J023_9PEZI|nr:hypothetical protein K461DRAFT_279756 [Myriangium duriaei CBS 260.36]
MAELHSALERLAPLDFSEVPTNELTEYMRSALEAGELICNSVPPPPGGEDFQSSRPALSEPNTAASAKDIAASNARAPEPHSSHGDLQKAWGKPYKFSAKENPLDVKVYKMAAHDRHGAWFARRSVHEGISFERMKKAMQWEFLESLAIEGGPGAGAVRGIGVDSRLEQFNVGKKGQLEVWQLSAQFPGPTTPREFYTMRMTSGDALSSKSSADGKHVPRHFMSMSRPVTHPEVSERSGYILGKYESVELIREIPLHRNKRSASVTNLADHTAASGHTTGRDRGSTISYAESRGRDAKGEKVDNHQSSQQAKDNEAEELNPIEWIMVTRSDPGGGIPRFMVERGTPSSIIADVSKFFDWACSKKDIPDPENDDMGEALEIVRTQAPTDGSADRAAAPAAEKISVESGPTTEVPAQGGYLDSAKRIIGAGVDAYAPAPVAEWLKPEQAEVNNVDDDLSSDSSSYQSADDFGHAGVLSTDSLPLSDTQQSIPSSSGSAITTGISHHDRELRKLDQHKEKLDHKLAKKREAEANKLNSQQGKSEADQKKAKERHENEMKKTEEKHSKDVEKLEAKKNKEIEKARKKRQKQLDKDIVAKVTRERDDFRRRIDMIQRENQLLREQIGDVQQENTALVHKLSKLAGGDVAMQAIRDEIASAKKRPTSSIRSGSSLR